MLVDYDVMSNWGNWQYVSGVGTDPRADRYFFVIKQGYDYDENGDYVKQWLPSLKNVPTKYIHCPYLMSIMEQKRLNVLIGKDYPEPIVKLKAQWNVNGPRKINKFAANSKKKDF